MTDKKSDAGDEPKQTVITKEEWHTQELVAHLLGDDNHSDGLSAKTTRTPGISPQTLRLAKGGLRSCTCSISENTDYRESYGLALRVMGRS